MYTRIDVATRSSMLFANIECWHTTLIFGGDCTPYVVTTTSILFFRVHNIGTTADATSFDMRTKAFPVSRNIFAVVRPAVVSLRKLPNVDGRATAGHHGVNLPWVPLVVVAVVDLHSAYRDACDEVDVAVAVVKAGGDLLFFFSACCTFLRSGFSRRNSGISCPRLGTSLSAMGVRHHRSCRTGCCPWRLATVSCCVACGRYAPCLRPLFVYSVRIWVALHSLRRSWRCPCTCWESTFSLEELAGSWSPGRFYPYWHVLVRF